MAGIVGDTPVVRSPVRRAALARVAGHGRSFPKRWARPAVLNAWMDPKDKPGAYNPCGVSPDPLAPATLAGRDSTHQLPAIRSEEHTSELQSLMRNSYAVFCLKKKITIQTLHIHQ